MSKPKINVKLLDRTFRYIERHPDELDQGSWRCATGMCFAGRACHLAGGTWVNPVAAFRAGDEFLIAVQADQAAGMPVCYDGKIHARDRAQRLLGLDEGQARSLFDMSNNMDDLREIVDRLKAEAALEGSDDPEAAAR